MLNTVALISHQIKRHSSWYSNIRIEWLVESLTEHTQMPYSLEMQGEWTNAQSSLYTRVSCYGLFFIAPVSFPHSCLSLEAETWRRTAFPALSATEELSVSSLHVLACKKSRDLGKINEIRMLEQHIMCVSSVSAILWRVGGPFVITFVCMILNLIYFCPRCYRDKN